MKVTSKSGAAIAAAAATLFLAGMTISTNAQAADGLGILALVLLLAGCTGGRLRQS